VDSRAVLVGTSEHSVPSIALPQAAANVADLGRVLSGPIGLLDASAVQSIVNPTSAAEVLDAITAPVASQLSLVLFYFAGHGMTYGAEKRLSLALPTSIDTPKEAAKTGLTVSDVLTALTYVEARNAVVILDCCFAGRALDEPGTGDIHVLCASGRPDKALTQADSRNTGFTGALLDLLRDGVPDGPEYLDLRTLYRRLSVVLPTTPCPSEGDPDRKLPAPHQRTTDSHEDMALVRNPAFGTARSRDGLEARARFAQRVADLGASSHRARGHLSHAAAMFGELAADAMAVFPRNDPQVLRYRRAHAALSGEAGHASRAVRILEEIISDLRAASTDHEADCKAEQLSLDHWITKATDPGAPRF
jgi:hypothetical protein